VSRKDLGGDFSQLLHTLVHIFLGQFVVAQTVALGRVAVPAGLEGDEVAGDDNGAFLGVDDNALTTNGVAGGVYD
jgi:hypothetical protein